MSEIQFSIIIPLYQKRATIIRCIDSILAQSHIDYELLIIDDGSTDRAVELITSIEDSRIRIIQQMNQGVSAARNKGIQEARYEYLAFIDADDEWSPEHLENMAQLIQKYPNCGWYSGKVEYITKSRKKPQFIEQKEGIYHNFFEIGLESILVHSSTVVIPKKIAEELGGFPVGITRGEDSVMWIRIASHYPIAYSPKLSGKYYFEEGNIRRRLKKREADIYFEHYEEGNTAKNEYLAIHGIHRAKMESIYGDRKMALEMEQHYSYTKKFHTQWLKLHKLNRTPACLIRFYYLMLFILVQTRRNLFPIK